MEIAVFSGPNGETAPMKKTGEIRVYQYSCNMWELCRSMPFSLNSDQGLQGMRDCLKKAVDFLGECRTLAALSVTGIPFFELEKAGFDIWEIEGPAFKVLESIREAESVLTLTSSPPETNDDIPIPEPREISPGHYSISLKEIQNCNGKLTSKQILIPILKHMEFATLEIICTHVPPWLHEQILIGNLNAHIDKINNQDSQIIISRANDK